MVRNSNEQSSPYPNSPSNGDKPIELEWPKNLHFVDSITESVRHETDAALEDVENDQAEQLKPGPVYDARAVNELLHLGYSEEELVGFGDAPEARLGFVTFFDPGRTIQTVHADLRLRDPLAESFAENQQSLLSADEEDWYNRKPFAEREDAPCYRQIRMRSLNDSLWKSFAEQRELLSPDEEIPLARAVMTQMVIHYLATGDRLYPREWVRCRDVDSNDRHIYVGNFDAEGPYIDDIWGDSGRPDIGIAAEWRP